jgi:hypothetical protein
MDIQSRLLLTDDESDLRQKHTLNLLARRPGFRHKCRMLNRGYGRSRYRWPMHFGLLNNDRVWVMDETQLRGVGLETSILMAGFRQHFSTLAGCAHWWMSATLDVGRLATPEAPPQPQQLCLGKREQPLPAATAESAQPRYPPPPTGTIISFGNRKEPPKK